MSDTEISELKEMEAHIDQSLKSVRDMWLTTLKLAYRLGQMEVMRDRSSPPASNDPRSACETDTMQC